MILIALAMLADPLAPLPPPYAAFLPTVPGAINPAVTQANIHQTICSKAKDMHGHTWVHNQRPPVAYTNKIKFALMDAAGIPRAKAGLFELDHETSIEDGGSPDDPANLWLQPYAGQWGARTKDKIETRLKTLVCNGSIDLATAQHELQFDWIESYKARIGK